jgi:hypothetical protein
MGNLLITAAETMDLKQILKSDDMFISGGDIAFAGMAIGGNLVSSHDFASYLASLSHILTRIVLSDRLVFVYSPDQGAEEPPTSYLLPLIERHCSTVQIDQRYALVSPVVEDAFTKPVEVFGNEFVTGVAQSVRRYAPWIVDDEMAYGLLAEYGVANLVGASYAPNPFVSQPFALHALRGRATEDELLNYVEDLRRETSEAMNLYRGLAIYDLKVPALLAAILRESKHPSDFVAIASQMNAEAKAFRSWCRSLDSAVGEDPKEYLDQLRTAEESLGRLGKSLGLGVQEVERMQVSTSMVGLGINLPAPTLKKIIDFLNVDVKFFRPRSFLLNVLASARQVQRLYPELERVFRLRRDYAKEAADHFLSMAKSAGR